MDSSSRSIVLNLFKQMIEWRREQSRTSVSIELWWNEFQLSVVHDYFSDLSTTCVFKDLPYARLFNVAFRYTGPGSTISRAVIVAFFSQNLEGTFFKVPSMQNNLIKKYQLLEFFISFLLRLLYCTFDDVRIDPHLVKELKFLLTFLGDTSLMLRAGGNEAFRQLLAEFEAVANRAGILVYALAFSSDLVSGKLYEVTSVVLNFLDVLKANIMKFLNLLPPSRRSLTYYVTSKTSVMDSFLIVDSLIDDLEDVMNREDNPIADDVKDQITVLHRGLISLRASIIEIGPRRPSEIAELKKALMRIGDVAHEAEYLIISFLAGDAPLWYLINRLTDVNHVIEFIGIDLQEITMKYKFGGLKVAECLSSHPTLQAKRNLEVDDNITVGFEDKTTHVLDQLIRGTKSLQVISIFGMAGLGKTTLAKSLYKHPSVNCRFDKLSWCAVSQTYQMRSVLTAVLIQIRSELNKDEILKMEEASIVEQIYKTLKGRRYLMVMDDIWDSNALDDLLRCFPDDKNGSRILFTTRNEDVAPPNSIFYALPSLSDDQCWELLEKKVFGGRPCPPELQGIGKEIAANCRRLPLTVVVVAGILSTMEKEKSTWEEVGGNLASYICDGGENSVMQILELSYKHLPVYLKPCFLYFGAFREDEEIPVRKLIRLWIAEGFISGEEEKNAEIVAEKYLMELIGKSLVMVAKRRSDDGGVKDCVIHDLLRDLCLKSSEAENFMKFVKSDDYSIYDKCHRLQALGHSITSSYCQHVRSFHGRGLVSPLYVWNMKLLRVLHFDYVDNRYLGIEFLINVRYLVINDLSTSIDNLVNLEYLRVETINEVFLPPGIRRMKKLRYIHVESGAIYDEECDSCQQANNLEFLTCVIIRKLKDEEMLRRSPNLRKLKCKGDNIMHGGITDFNFCFLNQLESLNVGFDGLSMGGISFPTNIRKLTLSRTWLLDEHVSMVGRLENLQVFKLISSNFEGERWDLRERGDQFKKLRFLKLHETNLTEWMNVEYWSQHFPELRQLILSDCKHLQKIPSEIGEIATLQLIEVKGAINHWRSRLKEFNKNN